MHPPMIQFHSPGTPNPDQLWEIKTAFYDMVNEWPLHSLAWLFFGFREQLLVLSANWGPIVVFFGAIFSTTLLFFRIVNVFYGGFIAFRDRHKPRMRPK